MRRQQFTIWSIVFIALLSGILVHLSSAQSNTPIQLRIFEVDSTQYPAITANFSLFDPNTGRAPEVNQDNITITYGSETLPITNFTPIDPQNNPRRVNIMLCIDLTDSNVEEFTIAEQQRTAQQIFSTLNSSDYLGIVAFSNNGAQLLRPLSPFNQSEADALILPLEIINGPSNTFFDALTLSIAEFESLAGEDNQVNAVILMTDVEKPNALDMQKLNNQQYQAAAQQRQETIVQNARNAGIKLFIIGYGKAVADILQPYGAATNGFTYLQSQLDNEFGQVTNFILNGLNQEYQVTGTASAAANDAAQPLIVQYRSGSIATSGRQESVAATGRPIEINFNNIQTGQIYSDEIRFDPQIRYVDTQTTPQLVFVEYRLARTPNGASDTLLSPSDSLDTKFTWPVNDKQEGTYVVQLTVRDQVGNIGSGEAEFQVSQALEIRFFDPSDPARNVTDYRLTQQPKNLVYARVLSKEFDILSVVLRVENNKGEVLEYPMTVTNALPTAAEGTAEVTAESSPVVNQALSDEEGLYKIRQTYSVDLNTSEFSPQTYTLSVVATDSRQNRVFATSPLSIVLSEDNTSTASFNIVILVALFLLIVIVVAAVTYTNNTRAARDRKLKEAEEMRLRQEQEAMRRAIVGVAAGATASSGRLGYLVVQQGKSPTGKDIYTLQPNGRHLLGRSQTNDIVLMGASASRNHAEILGDGNGLYTIRDLYPDKGNPTFINGQPLQGKHTLGEGNQVRIGDTILLFTYQSPK